MLRTFRKPLLVLLALISTPILAQETENVRQVGPWVWGLQGGAVQQFSAGLSDGPGEFDVSRVVLQPSIGYAWDRRTSVSLSLGVGSSKYEFSRDAAIDGLSPWGKIEDYRISLPVRLSPTRRSDVIVIPSMRSYVESGTSLGDGRTEGVLVGASWRFSENLSLGPGFGWFSELGGGSNAFPILVVDWSITDKLSLTTGRGLAASQGPGLTLNYKLSDRWKLGLTGRYEKIRFALNGEGASRGGYGEDRSLPLLLRATYSPWPMTSISAVVGAELEGSLSLEDAGGRRIGNADYGTAPLIGFSFSSRF